MVPSSSSFFFKEKLTLNILVYDNNVVSTCVSFHCDSPPRALLSAELALTDLVC